MNRLRIVQQGYDSLSPDLDQGLDEAVSDRVEEWLRRDVCPVVVELSANRTFRQQARWSLEHLVPGAGTAERRLVENVDSSLITLADQLNQRHTRQKSQPRHGSGLTVAMNHFDWEALPFIAERPWFDLVCSEEFFHPTQRLHLRNSSLMHTQAFDRQAELRVPLGDYVARAMFARIDYWKNLLDPLVRHSLAQTMADSRLDLESSEAVHKSLFTLDQAVTELREACSRDPSVRLREACTTLTQVYAAYAPVPELEWLSPLSTRIDGIRPDIRWCIRRRGKIRVFHQDSDGARQFIKSEWGSLCDPDTVRQIAHALNEVVVLYDLPEDPDDMVEWALQHGRLILVDTSPRQVFWEGLPVAEGQWDKTEVQWNLLWTLAEHTEQLIDQEVLRRPGKQHIKSRRSRLAEILEGCPALDQRIETVRGQGYRLALEAKDVILLQDDGHGRLEIVNSHPLATH